MGGQSSVRRQSKAVLEAIATLRDEGHTIDEILAHINAMGSGVKRSSLGRYIKHIDEVAAEIRGMREMASAVAQRLPEVTGDAGRVLIESIQAFVFQVRMQAAQKEQLSSGDAIKLASAAESLERAMHRNLQWVQKIKEQTTKENAEKAKKSATERGISADVANAIMRDVLGIGAEEKPNA